VLKGFVVVVIVFAVIGSLISFLLGQPCWFWCYCLLVHDKDFFLVLFVIVWGCLANFGSIFFVYGSVVLLVVLCASCDYLGAMGDSSSTPPMSLSHHAPVQRITSDLLNGQNFAAWSRSLRLYLGGKGKSG
jgi:hypothetical protein